MPVLELTQLRLLNGVAPKDPLLLKALSTVRDALQTQSQFYSCIQDPALIYILGLWPNLDAHHEFLASPRAKEILGLQEDMLGFTWTVHVELDAMTSLPLEAPVMGITRRTVRQGRDDAHINGLAKERQTLLESSRYKVASGVRIDAAPGIHEVVTFTGWENTQAHDAFTTKLAEVGDPAATDIYETAQVYLAWNLEGK
ncbi:hypothetical protein BU26DRAFT_414318 [Trematosphaeria pertusa]|uniref:ABM domain-containing protein n=1 Tax=Trematosphaeria pertusa TaxID=390896 RepID=A0A6A6J0A9_9PLEO|nr:uncharacterized protein BU26DRAFT_414318 [Trematosphaeria pertusa]KAF2256261.1 hypothetical protein BU26DRAFT_414318 [Trematosphaeria pertusa]